MDEKEKPRFPSAAIWTAIFTGVLTVVAILQWLAYQKANDLNIANQQATINSAGPAWQPILAPDAKSITGWRFQYGWVNTGHLPAKSVVSQINVSLGDKRPERGLDFATLPQGSTILGVIGPGSSFSTPELDVSVNDMKSVALGQKHLFFWGWAVYEDSLSSKKRLTEFCNDFTSVEFSKPDPTSPTSTLIAQWPPCQIHNCYDEQCEDYNERTK
jgi:hypothetical protein